eukprot:COSAG04_NODE_961_length_9156_cov_2.510488_5_plen_49_part_00
MTVIPETSGRKKFHRLRSRALALSSSWLPAGQPASSYALISWQNSATF